MLSEEVIASILEHPSSNAGIVAQEVGEQHGRVITPPQVLRLRAEHQRDSNVRSARSKASERLDEKIDLTEELIAGYVDIINDKTIQTRDRLKAMSDLRGWVKLAIDSSGDVGISETIFEIGGEWDLGFEPKETSQA